MGGKRQRKAERDRFPAPAGERGLERKKEKRTRQEGKEERPAPAGGKDEDRECLERQHREHDVDRAAREDEVAHPNGRLSRTISQVNATAMLTQAR